MKDRKLYIIGNGFDLWHGMPTGLSEFKEFVEVHDSDLLKAVQDYLPADEDWSDLELALADIDVESIVQDHEHLMMPYGAEDWSDSGHHDYQYEVSRVVETLSKELRSRLGEWIRRVRVPTPATAEARLRSIEPTSLFLTSSVVALNPAIRGHFKTGHRDWPET
jgi:Bacteriophage abortive infection AbiH